MNLDTYLLLDSIAMALVFVGVAGESCPEFFNFPKAARPQVLVKKVSLGLLILGLAGELWAGRRVSQITSVEIAASNRDAQAAIAKAADANVRAAIANVNAESLRTQNLLLQKQLEAERTQRLNLARDVAPRYFSYQAVWPKLKPFDGTKFAVWFVQDPEAERLARLIDETLRAARWVSVSRLMIEENVNADDAGVYVEVPYQPFYPPLSGTQLQDWNRTNDAAKALSLLLARYNIGVMLAGPVGGDLPPGTIRVRVHFKPDPKSTRVMLEELQKEISLTKH